MVTLKARTEKPPWRDERVGGKVTRGILGCDNVLFLEIDQGDFIFIPC